MAYNKETLTKLGALEELAKRVKQDYATKAELTTAANDATAALKSAKVDGNTVSFFTNTDKSGTAAFSFDFPEELFLDQTKTAFVDKFHWTQEAYPGSTNPELEGKPVMVLAVKGDGDSVTYSFLSMAQLVDTYTAKATGKDPSTKVTVKDYEIDVQVKISEEDNNQLSVKNDGLFVPKPATVDITGKADKVTNATADNFAALDANGNLKDSGKKAADFVAAETGKGLSSNDFTNDEKTKLGGIAEGATKFETTTTLGVVKINDVETTLFEVATDAEVTEMLNSVFGTTTA